MKKINQFFLFVLLSSTFLYPSSSISEINETKSSNELNLLIEKYILNNPEIIIKAIEIYQNNQRINALEKEKLLIKSNYIDIFEDVNSYVTGNKNSNIKIVEFIDYNCGYCKKNHEILMQYIKENPDVSYILKELPILGESSLLASKIAISILIKDGSLVYEKFLNLLMSYNRQLDFNNLVSFAEKAGTKIEDLKKQIESSAVNSIIDNNLSLAEKLQINGTPTFIIGKKIISGFISSTQLEEIVESIKKNQ